MSRAPLSYDIEMKACSVDGCSKPFLAKGLCAAHYWRQRVNGDLVRRRRERGTGTFNRKYHIRMVNGVRKPEHVRIAESVLGRELPVGAQVHHVDLNKSNNTHSNLVICPDQAYHRLLHRRQQAFDACGHADWLRCSICKKFDHPEALHVVETPGKQMRSYHRACSKEQYRLQRARAK